MSGITGHFPNLEVMLAAEEHAKKRGPHFPHIEGGDREEFVGRFTTEQLVAIATGAVDIKQLAHDELTARGVARAL